MGVIDILQAPWAIVPSKLTEIAAVYASHVRGEKLDFSAFESRIPMQSNAQTANYELVDGVAILPIQGVIAKRANLFMQICGGASTELIARDLRDAVADPAVHAIILHIDSPGGSVDGTQQLADAVLAAKQHKKVVAFADGMMASAAYWIGSAAESVYIADSTTQVGSIGVVATHQDVSGAEAAQGVKTTEIYAGQFKRIDSQFGPLSESGKASIQGKVDYLYELFVGAVATHRGVSTDQVLANMADGRVFIGQQAIDAGLVDAEISLDGLIAQLSASSTTLPFVKPKPQPKGKTAMNRDELQAAHPELVQSLLDEGRSEGASAERERILGIEATAMPGHEALIAELKADGKTTPDQAAGRVLKAEKAKLQGSADALSNDAPPPVPAQPEPSAASGKKDRNQLAQRANQLVSEAAAKGQSLTYAKAVALANQE